MRMESRWKEEDLDEYEDEDGYGYEDEGMEREEEEEEEEYPKPTQEELDYLKLREKLKEKIRQKYRKENAGGRGGSVASSDRKRASAASEFGSFFGPSMPVIARRVIEESHSLRETHHMISKAPNSCSNNKRPPAVANAGRKICAPKAVNELKTKVEVLKDMRDYSFLLSDDTDLPLPAKDPPSRNHQSMPNHGQGPTKLNASASRPSRPVHSIHELKKPASLQHQVKAGSAKVSLENRSKSLSGSGPGRPSVQKAMSGASLNVVSKKPHSLSINKTNLERKSLAGKPDPSSQRQHQELRRESQGVPKVMVAPRQAASFSKAQNSKHEQPGYQSKPQQPGYPSKFQQQGYPSKPQQQGYPSKPQQQGYPSKPQQQGYSSKPQQQGYSSKSQQQGYLSKPQHQGYSSKPQQQVSMKPQLSKPSKQILQRTSSHVNHVKRKPMNRYSDEEDDDAKAISMIRNMFRYNPAEYEDDNDDSDMEANFEEVMKEERRSAKIAQKEDEEQLRLIEEEERREKMRKMAKRRKLG